MDFRVTQANCMKLIIMKISNTYTNKNINPHENYNEASFSFLIFMSFSLICHFLHYYVHNFDCYSSSIIFLSFMFSITMPLTILYAGVSQVFQCIFDFFCCTCRICICLFCHSRKHCNSVIKDIKTNQSVKQC